MELAVFRDAPPQDLVDRWRDCLHHGDFPTYYTSPEYFREPAPPRQRPFAILAMEHGEVVGVLTGTQTDRELTCGIPTRPQICLRQGRDSAPIVQALANRVLAESRSASLITLCTWTPIEGLSKSGFRGTQADLSRSISRAERTRSSGNFPATDVSTSRKPSGRALKSCRAQPMTTSPNTTKCIARGATTNVRRRRRHSRTCASCCV